MSLPALTVPTPTVVDSLFYPVGSVVGADTATDKWLVHPTGMHIGADGGWVGGGGTEVDGGAPAFTVAEWIGSPLGLNHYSAIQSIAALDTFMCGGNAVRCDPATDSAYVLFEIADFSGDPGMHVVALIRRVNGVNTTLATWYDSYSATGFPSGYNGWYQDDHLWMLEVVGTNPVTLRASVFLNRLHETYQESPAGNAVNAGALGHSALMALPGDVWDQGAGPVCKVFGTFIDSSPQRLVTGGPGVAWTGGANNAGGIFGFNAGEIPIVTLPATLDATNTDPTTTASPDADGTSLDLTAGQVAEWTVDAGTGGQFRASGGISASSATLAVDGATVATLTGAFAPTFTLAAGIRTIRVTAAGELVLSAITAGLAVAVPHTIHVEAGGAVVHATIYPGADLGPATVTTSSGSLGRSASKGLPAATASAAAGSLSVPTVTKGLPASTVATSADAITIYVSATQGHIIRVSSGGALAYAHVVPGADLAGAESTTAAGALALSGVLQLPASSATTSAAAISAAAYFLPPVTATTSTGALGRSASVGLPAATATSSTGSVGSGVVVSLPAATAMTSTGDFVIAGAVQFPWATATTSASAVGVPALGERTVDVFAKRVPIGILADAESGGVRADRVLIGIMAKGSAT